MSGAVAIVLLLNGVQVDLPTPALLINGAAHVPVRAVCERVGVKVAWRRDDIVIDVGGQAHVLTVQPPGKTTSQGCCVALGTVYAGARHVAQLLGGQTKWSPAIRSLELWLPPAGTPEVVAAARSLTSDPLAYRGRIFSISGRYAGARGLSPTAPAAGLAARGFSLERDGTIYCSTQEFRVDGAPSPFSDRGRAFQATGQAALQTTGAPLLKVMGLQTDPQAVPAAVRIDPVIQRASNPNPVRIRVVTSDPATTETRPLSLRIASPGGKPYVLALPRDSFRPVAGADAGGPILWEAVVDWPLPASEGRSSSGVWTIQLLGGRPDPVVETAVSVDSHAASDTRGH